MSTNLSARISRGLSRPAGGPGDSGAPDGASQGGGPGGHRGSGGGPGGFRGSGSGRRRLSYPVLLLLVAGGLVVLSLLRVLTGAEGLTSSGQIGGAISLAVPIGLAGLGGLWAERSGVINIGLEGMMMLGTFGAGWMGWQHGPWAAVLAGVVGGVLGGLVHAVATVTFGVDHIVSGVAINILALGVVQFLAKLWFGAEGSAAAAAGGNDKQSPPMEDMPAFTVPWLADELHRLERQEWFLLSDAAGLLRAGVHEVSWLTLLAVALFVGTFYVLWRSPFGLRLRSCGENPAAAESLGVNVYLHKYAALAVSGGLAGLGGAFLAIFVHMYSDGQTGGRGYLGLATMIFGNWRPGGVALGAGLFGYMDALQVRGGGPTVHALLLLFAVVLAGLALWRLRSGKRSQAVAMVAIAGLLGIWFLGTETVPLELVEATPYLATLVVLTLFAQRLRVPKAIGKPYRRGQGT